jgi:hypothetical protein
LSSAEVLGQYSTSPYDCFHSDFQPLNNSGSTTNECPIAHLNAAAKGGPGSDVDILAQAAIMIDSGPSVNNRVSANDYISLNDCAGHDLDAFVQMRSSINPCRRMQEHRKPISSLLHTLKNLMPSGRADQLPYTIDQLYGAWIQGVKRSVTAQDRYSAPLPADLIFQ